MKIKLDMNERTIYATNKDYRFLVLYVNQFGALIAPLRWKKYYHIDDLFINDKEAVAIDQIAHHEFKWFDKVGWNEAGVVDDATYERVTKALYRMVNGETINMPGVGLCYKDEAEEISANFIDNMDIIALAFSKKYFDLLKGCDLSDRTNRQYPRRKMFSGSEVKGISSQSVSEIMDGYDVDEITARIMISNAQEVMERFGKIDF